MYQWKQSFDEVQHKKPRAQTATIKKHTYSSDCGSEGQIIILARMCAEPEITPLVILIPTHFK